jgi:hypothetical protein
VVELRPAGLVEHDHLAVDYGLVNVGTAAICSPMRLEMAQDIAVARG